MNDEVRRLVDGYRRSPTLGPMLGMILLRFMALLVVKSILTRAEFEWVLWGDRGLAVAPDQGDPPTGGWGIMSTRHAP